MPTAPLPPCFDPTCPERRPCPVHGHAHALEREHRRPNRDVRRWYYVARWVHPDYGLRAQVLAADPWCVMCRAIGELEPASEVDHVVPHRGDPRLFWDLANLQGLCGPCHGRKTGQGS